MGLHSLILKVGKLLQFLVLRDTLAVNMVDHLICLDALQINVLSLFTIVQRWITIPILRMVLFLVVLLSILVNLEFVNLVLILMILLILLIVEFSILRATASLNLIIVLLHLIHAIFLRFGKHHALTVRNRLSFLDMVHELRFRSE